MKESITNLKFVWKYARKEKIKIIIYILLNILSLVISVIMPILSAKVIINLTNNDFYQLIMISVVIFLIRTLSNIGNFISSKLYQRIFRSILVDLQTSISREMLKLDNKTLDDNGSGVFIQRITSDGTMLSESVVWMTTLISDITRNIGVFVAMFIINVYFFILQVVIFLIIYTINNHRIKIQTKLDKINREDRERHTSFVGETIRGARDIKMLNSEETFMHKMKSLIINVNNSRFNLADNRRRHTSAIDFVNSTGNLLMIVLLVFLIKYNGLEVANALVLYNYSDRCKNLSGSIVRFTEFLQDFNLCVIRVREIMDGEKYIKEKFGTKHLKKVNGDFEFKNVSFKYDENEVLDKLSFKVNANETVAFVGKSGAGKTTIFSLLCKMYDNYGGKITIDGNDIRELDKDSIRGNITIVSQNPYIFNLSIKDNLKLVCDHLTDKQMKEACKMACLDEFIESLPDKYDTIVGEGGITLSGGQKQRLAIARAFVQKTEIILFDEATSALDNETQHKIQKAIDNLQKDYTILIIAHRLSTIKNANRILFIEDGKIKQEGTHEELLKNCKSYKELYEAEIEK